MDAHGKRDGARRGSPCLDVILGAFLNQADALEHIGDIIDAPLLDAQPDGRLVEVEHALWCSLNECHKLLGQEAQAAIVPAGLLLGHGSLRRGVPAPRQPTTRRPR